ncbi:hypothetical protein LUZ60_017152 [Juncus effusus]|nr:hypothetical protein LUZ60_017152 [Juncus effusus]
MQRVSPPKHRHDGTSPLPLGMDWSPAPKKWEGRNTVWPHNHQTGWSYCVTIPSWIMQSDPNSSNSAFLKSVTFYRVHVGIQSPEGVSSSHGVLHRFSDFLSLYSSVKKMFPRKSIPVAPSRKSLLNVNTDKMLLEERRRELEEWLTKLLSDIDISRSAPVASFLDLEAAVRSSFEEWNQNPSVGPSSNMNNFADFSKFESSSHSVLSDVESTDTGDSTLIIDQNSKQLTEKDTNNNNINNNNNNVFHAHARRSSSESITSETSSIPGYINNNNNLFEGSQDLSNFVENLNSGIESQSETLIAIPIDQRNKLVRLLLTLQRRLGTAKTDMEDLIARLNQETAVKDYLNTKVKDLEVELEATKQKSKETLQQAILVERERVTQMQWDMDELRRKCSEMESKLKFSQDEKSRAESERTSASGEKEILVQELEVKKEQLNNVKKHLEEVEMKSKADIKVLVKEVKSLRNSQAELKKLATKYSEEKSELQRELNNERQRCKNENMSRKKLLYECKLLRERLKDPECSVNLFSEENEKLNADPSLINDNLSLLKTSDDRISLLLAEAQLLAREDESTSSDSNEISKNENNGENIIISDEEIRKALSDLFIDNAQLRKQLNSVTRLALNAKSEREETEEAPSRRTVLNRFLSS